MARGDGDTDIMGGWYPSTVRSACPGVNILRPFLEVQKADLQEVCQKEGVEWIEEPSNQLDNNNIYKNIREVMQQNEELVPGITGLLKTCRERRRHLEQQGTCIICVGGIVTLNIFRELIFTRKVTGTYSGEKIKFYHE